MNLQEFFKTQILDRVKVLDKETIKKSAVDFWDSKRSRKNVYITIGIFAAMLALNLYNMANPVPTAIEKPNEIAEPPPAVIKNIKTGNAKVNFEIVETEATFPKIKFSATLPIEKDGETNLTIRDCVRCGIRLSIIPVHETIASNEKFLGAGKLFAITDFESYESNNIDSVIDTKQFGSRFAGFPMGDYVITMSVSGRDEKTDLSTTKTAFLGGLKNQTYQIELGKKENFLNSKVEELNLIVQDLYRIALAESESLVVDPDFAKKEKEFNQTVKEFAKTWPQLDESLQKLADGVEPALILHSLILLKPDHGDPLLRDLEAVTQKHLSAFLDQKF